MKYKVGDRVRIKEDISGCEYVNKDGKMDKWQGKIMTIRALEYDHYKMEEDKEDTKSNITYGWDWYKNMIDGLVEPKLSNTEILKLAIDTYGINNQALVCIEEMSELTKALIKLRRATTEEEIDTAREHVREEIADTKIMLQQMSMIFNEKKIAEIQELKIECLKNHLEDEREVEVVFGRHEIGGKQYKWINPDKHLIKIGAIAIADTKYGEAPIIVNNKITKKLKDVKHYRKIVRGVGK